MWREREPISCVTVLLLPLERSQGNGGSAPAWGAMRPLGGVCVGSVLLSVPQFPHPCGDKPTRAAGAHP